MVYQKKKKKKRTNDHTKTKALFWCKWLVPKAKALDLYRKTVESNQSIGTTCNTAWPIIGRVQPLFLLVWLIFRFGTFFFQREIVFNIFTILLQKTISNKLLQVVIGKKSNFSDRFKLETIITYHLWFVVKLLFVYLNNTSICIYIYTSR